MEHTSLAARTAALDGCTLEELLDLLVVPDVDEPAEQTTEDAAAAPLMVRVRITSPSSQTA